MANLGSIHTYRSEVDRIIRFGGSTKEISIRRAVFNLINAYARPRDLLLVEELDYFNPRRHKRVTPDGTLKNVLRIDQGFWESKDTHDDLTEEIKKKFDRGYPDSNILFEDYQQDELYDYAVRRLFKERLHKHDGYNICFAIRGNSHRTAAFRQALEQARDKFVRERGLTVTSQLNLKAAYPTAEPALQAVDYFLWALQRTYEKREDRFLELVWPQCSLVVDVDDTREAEYGAYYTKQKPLKAAALKAG